MLTPRRTPPYAHTKMAQFLAKRLDELRPELSQGEIAMRLGYRTANIVSMFKTGESKVPLEKIPVLAEAIRADVAYLMRLGLEQYWPGRLDVIGRVFSPITTENELEVLTEIRRATGGSNPKFTSGQLRIIAGIASGV